MESIKPRVGICTLGCKVNQYESEAIAEGFARADFSVCAPTLPCDVYVINTCTVTAESDRKARQMIRRMIHQNPKAYILVTGCLSQTQPREIADIEGVDYVCGNTEKMSVVDAAKTLLASGQKSACARICVNQLEGCGFEQMRIEKFDRTRAYIKIEDGCENRCSYCIIPSARGPVRSKRPEDVLTEVRTLTAGGCREIVLTGIETASYGKDLDSYTLADLLCEIDRIPGIGRVRLGSLDPSLMKQDFVDKIATLHSLAPHFHLSMQSGSDKILALMKRKYNTRMAMDGIKRLRAAMPDVQLTTDMIVGFPQESEENFEETLAFAKEAEFLMIHVFPYSRRRGTVADRMDGQLPSAIKQERVHRLSALQSEIRKSILDRQIGKEYDVLFETYKGGVAVGHTSNFIEVVCPSECPLHGEIRSVTIEGNDGERCFGSIEISNKKGDT